MTPPTDPTPDIVRHTMKTTCSNTSDCRQCFECRNAWYIRRLQWLEEELINEDAADRRPVEQIYEEREMTIMYYNRFLATFNYSLTEQIDTIQLVQ